VLHGLLLSLAGNS